MAEVRLCLFGAPRLTRNGQLVKIDTWKALALLAYLALNCQVHSREALATLFWPEQSESRARGSLRSALWTLRQALPADALAGDKQTVILRSSALLVDVLQFQSLVAATSGAAKVEADRVIPQLQSAIELYSADFLAGFTLRDCPAFDEWHFFLAEQLRHTVAGVYQRLIDWSSGRQEYATAIEYAQRWLALDPLHEPAHRWLMQLYVWTGRQPAAVRQYETCRRLLEQELGATPDEETSRLYDMIRSKLVAPPPRTETAASLAPALPAPAATRNNLPRFSTPLLGRDRELADLDRIMFERGERLISIVGLGGMGKTRLALAFAEEQLAAGRLRDGLCFVSLAATDDVQAIVPALMSALGISAEGSGASADARQRQIVDFLTGKQMLLIFDNFEQLLEGRMLLFEILTAAADVRILVTSRERLHLHAEQLYPLAGLECPAAFTDQATPALLLLLQAARRIDPHFEPDTADLKHLVHICHLVAGMPLALELAAAWLRLLKPSAIAEALQKNLDLLESTLHDLPLRHRSMRAVFDTTWMLLAEDELRIFAQLSIFRGGFSLEAAQHIAGANLTHLGALTDKSLIEYRRTTDRYEIHELLRQYGAEKLVAAATYEETSKRFFDYFLHLAERAEPHLRGAGRAAWMTSLGGDHYNLRLALDWACMRGKTKQALRLAGALLSYWLAQGAWVEGAQSIAAALALSTADISSNADLRSLAKALYAAGLLAWHQSDYARTKACADESLRLFEQLADDYGSAQAYHLLGLTARAQRDFALATQNFSTSLTLARKCEDKLLIATILSDMGGVAWRQNNFVKAYELHTECLAYHEAEQDAHGVALDLLDLGFVACWQGDLERARSLGERSLAGLRQLADPFYVAQALGLLAIVAYHQNEMEIAQSLIEQRLNCYRALGAQRSIAITLLWLGHVRRRQGAIAIAGQVVGEATAMLRQIGDRLNLIHALEAWLYLAVCHSKFELAARLSGTVDAWRARIDTPRPPVDRPEYERQLATIRTALDGSLFELAQAQGKELSLDQAFEDVAKLELLSSRLSTPARLLEEPILTRLELFLLGPPRVVVNGQTVEIAERKALALLAYLAVASETSPENRPENNRESYRRDTVATLLWPEQDQQRARANLRYTLWLLKTTLGDAWFVTDRESVGLHPQAAVWVDVADFQTLMAHGESVDEDAVTQRLAKAVTLYRADFLAGFTLADAPAFDDWQFFWGERLRRQLATALQKLVHYYDGQDALETALDYARRRLALDPLHEPTHRQLMRLYPRGDQRGMALRQYEECVRLLKQELDVAPEKETAALYEAIRTKRFPATSEGVEVGVSTEKAGLDQQLLAANHSPATQGASPIAPLKLPIASTSFVGREKELMQIAERLGDPAVRLVTIVGLGGMGKSRLAVEAATRMLDHFAGGVWFVALAPVTNANLIAAALATTLEIPTQGAIELEDHVIRYLAGKQMLLILDNLEHLLDGVSFVERLLAGAPGVKVLATSRVRLRLDLEWLFPLDGLTVPSSIDISKLTPAEYTAVDLFVQRARRLQPDFTLTISINISTTEHVLRVCRLVGGMPLAIELAAAWLRVVPLAEIAGEIEANLDFLATSLRNDSERHRSMHAVFDRSWRLLDDLERHTLLYVSVFRGGFARPAAADVMDAELRLLSGLVDSSWLQLNAQGRYEIHELARQYAEEKLDAEPATATRARIAHCAYYAAFAGRIGGLENMGSSEHGSRLKQLLVELDNIWAGWLWAAANRDFDAIGKFVDALAWLADAHGLYGQVVTEFEKICAVAREKLADLPETVALYRQIALELARLLANLCFLYGRAISVEQGLLAGAESVEWLRHLGLDGRSGEVSPSYLDALVYMSLTTAKYADYDQARLYCEEIMRLTRGKKEQLGFYCDGLNSLSQVAYLQGNFAEAESLLKECLALRDYIIIKEKLALVYTDTGDLPRAAHFAAIALSAAESAGSRPQFASALLTAAEVATSQGHFEEAEQNLDSAGEIAEETGNRYVRVRCLNGKARIARLLRRPVEAQKLYGEAYELAKSMARKKDTALAQVGVGFALLDQEKYEEARACLREALQAAWQRRIMPEVIWAVVGLAALKGYEGRPQIAGRWLQIAVGHPSCPKRVQVEAMEICTRLALPGIDPSLAGEQGQEPESALEGVVLELLC